MEFSTYPFRRLFDLWKEKRKLPEYQNEPVFTFYFWRVFSFLGCTALYLSFQLGMPMLFILVEKNWPGSSNFTIGLIFIILVFIGFLFGFFSAKLLDKLILMIELRKPFFTPSA